MNNELIKVSPDQLQPHPDNRPLGINTEKVEQLAEMMRQNGYDQSKPLKVRPNGSPGMFQIIEGEHRWRAAQLAGVEFIPVYVKDLDDKKALEELDTGNEQTANDNLSIGLMALNYIEKGYGNLKDYARETGREKKYDSLKEWKRAAVVYRLIEAEKGHVSPYFRDTKLLNEISKCSEYDWVWCAELCAKQNLSFRDFQEVSKRIREIDKAAGPNAAQVFDLTEVKQECATAKERIYNNWVSLIEAVEDCAGKLNESYELFRYNFKDKEVESYEYLARQVFLSRLFNTKDLTRAEVFKAYDSALNAIKQQTQENAEADKEYYLDEANRAEQEERARAEWEAFIPEPGRWYEVGRHRLYCGDNRDPEFINALPDGAAFAFADPPYNAGVDEWDEGFTWDQDYLQDKAELVFVTPGIGNVPGLFRATKMDYKWSLSAWITNGMTRGALGFGNWIYIALFSKLESVHRNEQDFLKINISNPSDKEHTHRGEKPAELLEQLVSKYSKEGDAIVDPFLGSGTTLFACEKLGRVCYAAEISPAYCKDIIKKHKTLIKDDK